MATWERRWGIPRLEVYRTLSSTNDRARALADADAPPLATVIAEEQTAGRGREGRVWHSPAGLGLWLSSLLPGVAGDHLRLPLVVGLAVAKAVADQVPGVAVGLKWPNDVLVDGAKVCGILCERASGAAVVVGIGLNVSQREEDFPPELRGVATSLATAARRPVTRHRLAGSILEGLRPLAAGGVPPLEGPLGRRLRELDVLRGRPVVTSAVGSGTAVGIAPDGALLVESPRGAVGRVVAGTVRLAEERAAGARAEAGG